MNYTIQQLVYKDNQISKVEPIAITPSQNKTAIIVHAYYTDIWQEIQSYLAQLTIDYDLYVTVPEGTVDEEIIKILEGTENIHLYMTENRGRDVLPFLQVMKIIGADTYQYICKIHSKKTAGSALGQVWRKLLYYDLLGSNDIVQNILEMFDNNETVGMVTGKNTILDSQRYTYGNDSKIQELAKKLGMLYNAHYLFPAGTMFWTRSEIISPIVKLFIEDQLAFEEEAGQVDNTLAHAIERYFGIIAQATKKEIVESPSRYSLLDDSTLNEVAGLVLSQQYVGKDMFMAQKFAIEEKDREIAYLIEVAEAMRLKNRVKNLTNKVVPLGKKVAKIPHKAVQIAKVVKNNPTLLKKVFYYASRGELGYLISKIREKSSTNIRTSDKLTEVNLSDYFTDFDKDVYTIKDQTIDIIIPVYNGFEFLEALFDSVEKNTSSPYRLIVINDCSPDEKVKPYLLKRLEKHPTAIFIDHQENQGFLKSVNEAYTHVENHFVLLNTDTEVPPFWLERLMYPILHKDNIASTTPFTNSGEIASFPNFVADNEIFDGMDVEALDKSFQSVNAENFYAEVPTGVGFCMGINLDVAKQLGMFAEDTFGKGYGEENDWCQRAIKQGYKNLIVPNLFVYHKHGGSFSAEEKQKLLQKNIVTLNQRHPNYGKDVNDYLALNPHETLRHLLVLKASNQTHGLHLIFDHFLGGGANLYTQKRITRYVDEGKNVLLVAYDYYSHCYILTHRYKNYNFSFKITDFDALTAFINALNLTEIFVNNLVSYKQPLTLLAYIENLVNKSSAKLILPTHDFYIVCPSYNLLNEEGKYCAVPDIETCKSCMRSNMQEWRNFYDEEVDIEKWRTAWESLLTKSNKILFFSHSSKEIFLKAYPNTDTNKLIVKPHTVTDIEPLSLENNPQKTTTTIGILGAISYVKGSYIIKQMIQLIERDNLDINIVVIGEITEPIKSTHFHSTGKYQREALPKIIRDNQIDTFLIPSIWPETFSYTAQEVMMMELPLMVFNLGAPAERVKEYDKGIIINEISADAVLETVKSLNVK